MINVGSLAKKDCNGCCACKDICGHNAITYVTDNEGFWYPKVEEDLCTDCGLCIRTCPEINSEKVNQTNTEEALCYGAHHTDNRIRLDSTSGGVFSALANKIYDEGGYVAGAIYNEDFSVSHIISNNREDLEKIRSSKYLQSSCVDLYKGIRRLLVKGEKVLVCGCPCQMAALRLFLNKDYDNLVICDFICRGINSPKVFRKHLDSLEQSYKSKVVYAKAKNKELGWRKLTFKAIFANGKSYYGEGVNDNFTRGYLQTGVYCRPSCYECKFKEIPRIADITLGDFWGVEKINPSLDNDTGTSVVLCNSPKGESFFDSIQKQIVFSPVSMKDITPGNPSLLRSLPENGIDREAFFTDVDQKAFHDVAKKYFPFKKPSLKSKIKKAVVFIWDLLNTMRFNPVTFCHFLWINFLRKNTRSSIRNKFMVLTPSSVVDIHKNAKININGRFLFGFKKVRGSNLETRIRIEDGGTLNVNGDFILYGGADIQIFKGGELTLEGGPSAGMNMNGQIVCANKIKIGKSTLIGRNVVIRDYDAHIIKVKNYKISAPIDIGEHVWIGDGAMITKGVTIGDGSIVAARSWVINNVPSKMLVGGSPATPLEKDIEWEV